MKIFLILTLVLVLLPSLGSSQIPSLRKHAASDENSNDGPPVSSNLPEKVSLRVEFEGSHILPEDDIIKVFRERRFLSEGTMDPGKARSAKLTLKEWLTQDGYLHNKVKIRDEYAEAGRVITFVISEGPRARIADIVFTGNHVFQSSELKKEMLQSLDRFSDNHQIYYRPEIFNECGRLLKNFLTSRGYLQAKVGEPEKVESDGGLIISMPIEEGARYRIGKIEIEGLTVFSPQKVLEIIGIDTGDIANGETIGKGLFERLKRSYGDLGFIQYSSELEPHFIAAKGSADGIVNFKVLLEEGPRFTVRKLEFSGYEPMSDEQLLSALALREANHFSQQTFLESIASLNIIKLTKKAPASQPLTVRKIELEGDKPVSDVDLRRSFLLREGDPLTKEPFLDSLANLDRLGLFEPLDPDKDVDFHTDEEHSLVDLVVHLRKKE
jgi:outer membrane protein insertion porin family